MPNSFVLVYVFVPLDGCIFPLLELSTKTACMDKSL
uniref:Uncharacterized protein n=1 Tax=Arundo donax TaxID=35708 RepID=A0A0A8Z7J1_ARUDO